MLEGSFAEDIGKALNSRKKGIESTRDFLRQNEKEALAVRRALRQRSSAEQVLQADRVGTFFFNLKEKLEKGNALSRALGRGLFFDPFNRGDLYAKIRTATEEKRSAERNLSDSLTNLNRLAQPFGQQFSADDPKLYEKAGAHGERTSSTRHRVDGRIKLVQEFRETLEKHEKQHGVLLEKKSRGRFIAAVSLALEGVDLNTKMGRDNLLEEVYVNTDIHKKLTEAKALMVRREREATVPPPEINPWQDMLRTIGRKQERRGTYSPESEEPDKGPHQTLEIGYRFGGQKKRRSGYKLLGKEEKKEQEQKTQEAWKEPLRPKPKEIDAPEHELSR